MKLNDAARELIGSGTDATLVTLNPDGSPQVTVVWMALESTPDGDELVSAHLAEHKKVRNVRNDPRVAVTVPGRPQARAADALPGDHRHSADRGRRCSEATEKTRQGDAGLRRTLPATECAGGAAHPRPHRESGRPRPLDVLTPMRL